MTVVFSNELYDILITNCDNKQLPTTSNYLEVMFYVIAVGRNLLRVFYLLSVNLLLHWLKKKKKQFEIKHVRDKKKIEIPSFLFNMIHLFVILSFKLWIPNELAKVIDYL